MDEFRLDKNFLVRSKQQLRNSTTVRMRNLDPRNIRSNRRLLPNKEYNTWVFLKFFKMTRRISSTKCIVSWQEYILNILFHRIDQHFNLYYRLSIRLISICSSTINKHNFIILLILIILFHCCRRLETFSNS